MTKKHFESMAKIARQVYEECGPDDGLAVTLAFSQLARLYSTTFNEKRFLEAARPKVGV